MLALSKKLLTVYKYLQCTNWKPPSVYYPDLYTVPKTQSQASKNFGISWYSAKPIWAEKLYRKTNQRFVIVELIITD